MNGLNAGFSIICLDDFNQPVNRSFSIKRKPLAASSTPTHTSKIENPMVENAAPIVAVMSGQDSSDGQPQEQNKAQPDQQVSYPDGSFFQGKTNERGISVHGTLTYQLGNMFIGDFGLSGRPIKGTLFINESGDDDGEFEGQFKQGKPYQGVRKFADGRKVEDAKCDEEGRLVEGKETLPNGEVFTGTFAENKRSKGTVRYSNGNVYTGTFKQDGRRRDRGKMNYANGWTFDGSWVADQKGEGIFTWSVKGGTASLRGEFNSSGRIREGTTGTQISPSGRFDGTFHQTGNFCKGVWKESDGFKFEGTHNEDGTYKEGHMWYPSGSYYHGTFINNLKAEGELHTPKRDRFEGTFKEGKLSYGTYHFADHKKGYYKGSFGPDQQFAQGLITLPSGTVYDVNGAKRDYNHKLTKANLKKPKEQRRSGSQQVDRATADRVRGEINNMVNTSIFWNQYNNC